MDDVHYQSDCLGGRPKSPPTRPSSLPITWHYTCVLATVLIRWSFELKWCRALISNAATAQPSSMTGLPGVVGPVADVAPACPDASPGAGLAFVPFGRQALLDPGTISHYIVGCVQNTESKGSKSKSATRTRGTCSEEESWEGARRRRTGCPITSVLDSPHMLTFSSRGAAVGCHEPCSRTNYQETV